MQMGCSNTGKSGLLALQSSTFQKPVVIKIQKEERWLISSIGFFDGVWKGTSYHEVINRMVNLLISLKHGALSYNQHFKIKKKRTLTVLLEIYSFYALVEEAFVLVEFFCEEMVVFLDLVAF